MTTHVSEINSLAELREIIARPGYIIVMIYSLDDWGSRQFCAACAEESVAHPLMRFYKMNVAIARATVGGAQLSIGTHAITFVPTVLIYKSGHNLSHIVGANFAQLHAFLRDMQRDVLGSAVSRAPVSRAPNRAIFPSRARNLVGPHH